MNIIIRLVVGGLMGWLASNIMRTDAQQGIFPDGGHAAEPTPPREGE